MSEHAGPKSTSVMCVTAVGLHCSRNPRMRWPRSQYEWINTSAKQPAVERKRSLATDRTALCRASTRAHDNGVARARWVSASTESRRALIPCEGERAQRNMARSRDDGGSATMVPMQKAIAQTGMKARARSNKSAAAFRSP
eukprot:5244873-Pleurochrysis_carterae.AAC.1